VDALALFSMRQELPSLIVFFPIFAQSGGFYHFNPMISKCMVSLSQKFGMVDLYMLGH